jgi:two-component system LytT family response regulator
MNLNAVLVEDEVIAALNLQRLIAQVNGDVEVIAVLKSIEESVEWFSCNPSPDLAFMDIHLSDGSSFSIFEKARIEAPIIFTTAYDEYALKAFEVNSIDYLLKPVNIKDLERAMKKISRRFGDPSGRLHGENACNNEDVIAKMLSVFRKEKTVYKSNFLIPHKDKYIPLSVHDIACIYSENKIARMITFDSRALYENSSLDELQRQLDPSVFFRANRRYIISHRAIKDISVWFTGKLSINLSVAIPEKIIVSRERVAQFKEWYNFLRER